MYIVLHPENTVIVAIYIITNSTLKFKSKKCGC